MVAILHRVCRRECFGCGSVDHYRGQCDPEVLKSLPMCTGKVPATCRVRHPGHDCPFVGRDQWLKDGKLYVPTPESGEGCNDTPPPRRDDPGGRGGGAPGRGRGFRGRGFDRYPRNRTIDQHHQTPTQNQQTSQTDAEDTNQDDLNKADSEQPQEQQSAQRKIVVENRYRQQST